MTLETKVTLIDHSVYVQAYVDGQLRGSWRVVNGPHNQDSPPTKWGHYVFVYDQDGRFQRLHLTETQVSEVERLLK